MHSTLLAAGIKTPGQTAQIKSSLICPALVSPSGFRMCVYVLRSGVLRNV